MCSEESSSKFNANISNEKVENIILDISNKSVSTNYCVTEIEMLFMDAANSTFGPENEIGIDPKQSCKPKFSDATLSKKTAYNKAKQQNKPKY